MKFGEILDLCRNAGASHIAKLTCVCVCVHVIIVMALQSGFYSQKGRLRFPRDQVTCGTKELSIFPCPFIVLPQPLLVAA